MLDALFSAYCVRSGASGRENLPAELKQVNLVSAGLPSGSKRLFSLPGLFHIDPAFLSPGLSMFEHFFRKGFRALIKLGRSGEQFIMTMFLHLSSFQSKRTASKECLSPYVLR
jgi:hypothetical protein